MTRTRFVAALAAFVLSLPLFGCGPTRLHIRIPGFIAMGVDGLRLYRVGPGGALQNAVTIRFGGITLTSAGLQMEYTQFTPDNKVWGPLMVPVEMHGGWVDLEMTFVNRGAPGFFRFASYNEHGTSRPTTQQLYVGDGQS